MNEISKYFKEEWNKALFEKQNLDNQMQIIDNELSKLEQQENDISVREDNPDYVFQVDCFEKRMDEETLSSIAARRCELKERRLELEKLIEDKNVDINKFNNLYDESIRHNENKIKADIYDRIEFIIKLMDSDIQRAKIELTNFLKEERTDAD